MTQMPDAARMKRELAELIGIRSENPPGRESDAADYVAAACADGLEVSLDGIQTRPRQCRSAA